MDIHTSHQMELIPEESNRMCMKCFVCECHDHHGRLERECVPVVNL